MQNGGGNIDKSTGVERKVGMERQRLKSVALNKIDIHDLFWNKYIDLVEDVILPFQWELINDQVEGAEKSYCIRNFRTLIEKNGEPHRGMVFQDTDVAKWLEAVAYSLAKKKNGHLEELADQAIDLIEGAQCEDGYLNTYFTITGKERWTNLLEGHELYTAGHMIEAGVAYYEATGKEKILKVVRRFADYMCTVFGAEEGKNHGYPGHPEVELALVRLYHVTGEKRYLELSDYFVRTRGEKPCYFDTENCRKEGNYMFPEFADFENDYLQVHMPLREQTKAEGHAVRAVYLYCAMADLASEYQDEKLLEQCDKLWENITQKRMYITGSIGSASFGERFTCDYDLPNNTNYSESCATIGLAMFSNRMFQITRDGKYMDTVELALYNTLLSGIAMDGKHFFYVNPLEVIPEVAEKNPTMRHVKTTRQKWFGVACCPPNITRTLASMGNYMYAVGENTLYSNLFISSEISAPLECGEISVKLSADYPDNGEIRYEITGKEAGEFVIAIRRPHYCGFCIVKINGEEVSYEEERGYIYLERSWQPGDIVELSLDVAFRFIHCNPRVYENIGKIALVRGPRVYCLEEADNGNYLKSVLVSPETEIAEVYREDLLGGTLCASFRGKRIDYSNAGTNLYGTEKPAYEEDTLTAVPYCEWNNRGKGEMIVWLREQE